MKKNWLLGVAVLSLVALTLSGCSFNCDKDELTEAMQLCLANSWTHSIIHTQTAVYGECEFPSGVTCEDDLLMAWQCDFEPNLEDIDTEEERLAGCEENVNDWMKDFEEWAEEIVVEWWEESEAWASFVRNWVVKYIKDGFNWTMNAECVADFVDGSLSVSYDDEVAGDPVVVEEEPVEEVVEETAEEVVEETVEEVVEQPTEEVVEETPEEVAIEEIAAE